MTGEKDAGPFCLAEEHATKALCDKPPGHDGPHNGWAHYPGQLASWPKTPIPPGKDAL